MTRWQRLKAATRLRRALVLALVAVAATALGACDDDPTEPEGVEGTWTVETSEGTIFVRITDDEIHVFQEYGQCYARLDYDIISVTGDDYALQGPGGTLVTWTVDQNGDEILLTAPLEATWTLDANLDPVLATGSADVYTLDRSSQNVNSLGVCSVAGDFPTAACMSLPQLLLNGSAVNGALGPGDARWTDSTWYDLYRLQISNLSDVNITMQATNPSVVDTYLLLYNSTGTDRIASNDDIDFSGGDYNSRVQTTLAPGCYVVVANSYSVLPGEAGGYTLTASTTLVSEFQHAPCVNIPEVAVGGNVNGTLAPGDALWDADDSYYDLWSVQVDSETDVTITLRSTTLDTYLMLYNSLGTIRLDEDDDSGGGASGTDSQIVTTLEAGCYIAIANSYDVDGDPGGPYNLAVSSP